jgi:hypothetical protein
MTDIERCKTWVSDKTLIKIARALDTSPWLLLRPLADAADTGREEEEVESQATQEEFEALWQTTRDLKQSILKKLNEYINTALAELRLPAGQSEGGPSDRKN